MKKSIALILYTTIVLSLLACDHSIQTSTKLNEDGSLDKKIVLIKSDSVQINKNYFGVDANNGWVSKIEAFKTKGKIKENEKKKINITFSKSFESVAEANNILFNTHDSLYQIRSSFSKKFKWFYTYIYFSDTYIALNRFKNIQIAEFFTPEDYKFIERLPSEGSAISSADSLSLEQLNEKIYDHFSSRAIFEEQIQIVKNTINKHSLEKSWLDSLQKKKEGIYQILLSDKSSEIWSDDIGEYIIDSLKLPVESSILMSDYKTLNKDFESRLEFMSSASNAAILHRIEMPWEIINSNADSIKGQVLTWRPPITKLLITDYTMYAEARRMNYWAVVISVLIILSSFVFFIKKYN